MTSLPLFALLVLGVAAAVYATPVDTRGELIFTHVLYRHGDRAPSWPYPTDPYSNASNWPVPLGALTVRGMQMHFALGEWLRERYGDVLLSEQYTPNEIYIRSTDVDRTLQSAESNLAGLYPPHGDQVWNPDLAWQPIPVHTVPADEDWLIGPTVPPCPVYENAMSNLETDRVILEILDVSKPIMQYISENTGLPIPNTIDGLGDVSIVRDALYVEALYNKPLPEWSKKVYPTVEIDFLSKMYYTVESYTPTLAKIRSGFLLKDILDRSSLKNNGTLSPDLSVFVYSSHDNVLSNLMYSMNISNDQLVQYAACLLFELRSTPSGPVIEIYYKKSSDTDVAEPLYIPECGFACPISTFYELYDGIIPTEDFATTCTL